MAQTSNYIVKWNPYANMLGADADRALVQHHDHIGGSGNVILTAVLGAWDDAGYTIAPFHHYSGGATVSAFSERKWPFPVSGFDAGPETHETEKSLLNWLETNYSGNVKAMFPSSEEIGTASKHLLSPFLEEYIEDSGGSGDVDPADEYTSTQEAIHQILSKRGPGIPFVAHPTQTPISIYGLLTDFRGVEMYSAFGRWSVLERDPPLGVVWSEANFLARWDALLSNWNPYLLGLAVNDHVGPESTEIGVTPETENSGKVEARIHLGRSPDCIRAEYRKALQEGAFFAIKDLRSDKSTALGWLEITRFAHAQVVDGNGVKYHTLDIPDVTGETVTWKGSGGVTLGTGSLLKLEALHYPTRYARAEIVDGDVTIYTQPFVLQPNRF